MIINRSNVLGATIGVFIASFIIGAGPSPTNIALDMSIFMCKCAFVLLIIFACSKEK